MQSSDPQIRTCAHELARALEQYLTKEKVPLFGTQLEFETAAIQIARMLGEEKCPLKN